MAGKKGKSGRKPQSPGRKAIARVMHGEHAGPLHREAMTDVQVRRSKRFRAYDRLLTLAGEIDRELGLAEAATPQEPDKIHALQDRLRAALKEIIPYEKPRLARLKVSGDKENPLFDLSGLAEKELLLMRRMILKAKQVVETEDNEEE